MLIVGLTGSIGMGKSTAAARFRTLGVVVCDADALVHELYASIAVAPIEAAFPGSTVAGRVDRQTLAGLLLQDPSGYKKLEAIVHPMVQRAEAECLAVAATRGDKIAVVEVPLLFETGGERRVDITVVVSAPADKQRDRVLARAGMTAEKFEQIVSRQLPDDEKRRRADFVVDTGGTVAETEAQVDRLLGSLRGRSGTAFEQFWRLR